ncbi:membrane protein [Streptomyces cyaneogriseus subsp. noncyanogenus]|uniref:Membrane protein n=1 Tax=Streptomyces cyaneogriseus subsp. noncyanogenus TaxID=477245 RepID=A0A0C5G5U9_9ACTN|nr:DUF4190 domain-containing protein [Streptomyces cyaneogriseus]AJP03614.1 membrane protein [Streptomyces cyaneogriseus subsp. noncyanogenus]
MSIPPPPGPPQPHGPYGPCAQGPYPAQPQPVWGPGPGPYGAPAAVNGVAIAAFVLGLLCFLPAVGLVLGLVALRQIKRRGQRGKGFAVAGAALSAAGLALWTVSLATGAVTAFWDGVRDAARGGGTAYSLAEGECFDAPGGSLEGFAYDVDEVSCAAPHHGEVFAAFDLPAGSYPGEDTVARAAEDRCYTLRDGYAMDAWAVPGDVDVYYFAPTRQSWRTGDREVACLFGSTRTGGVLTGSLRTDETTLDGHQLAYLRAEQVLDRALDLEPDTEYVEDDLPGHREWAGRMAEALAERSERLRGHAWPAAARQPVAGLAGELETAREEWERAAGASDADTFYEHYEKGYDLIDPERAVGAREALGLATTPPSYEEDGGSEGGGSGGGGAAEEAGGMEV